MLVALTFAWPGPSLLHASDLPVGIDSFIQESCVNCHDENTETRLDVTSLGYDLADEAVFRKWVHVFDRVERGEMPPANEATPSAKSRLAALALLKSELVRVNRQSQQTVGRVPSRRLSRIEYEHTLHDLLGIGGDLAKHLPPESESGAFDVVAATQEMSGVHVRSLLRAADLALDEAIQLGKKPPMGTSVLFGSNLGNANAHDPRNLPILLAGGGYTHGQYVAHDALNNTPLCNLFVSVLNNIGIEADRFGTSTAALEV